MLMQESKSSKLWDLTAPFVWEGPAQTSTLAGRGSKHRHGVLEACRWRRIVIWRLPGGAGSKAIMAWRFPGGAGSTKLVV